jgi:hypothetical protein
MHHFIIHKNVAIFELRLTSGPTPNSCLLPGLAAAAAAPEALDRDGEPVRMPDADGHLTEL